jgi:hypothetical protein
MSYNQIAKALHIDAKTAKKATLSFPRKRESKRKE